MSRTWFFVIIGATPWVAAWLFYLYYTIYVQPAGKERERRLSETEAAEQHQRWLEHLRNEQRIAEEQAAHACAEAEVAAQQALSATGAVARRAAARAAQQAEITTAAAIAANISARHQPERTSAKAEELAARATRAAAEAQAAVDAAEAAAADPVPADSAR